MFSGRLEHWRHCVKAENVINWGLNAIVVTDFKLPKAARLAAYNEILIANVADSVLHQDMCDIWLWTLQSYPKSLFETEGETQYGALPPKFTQ